MCMRRNTRPTLLFARPVGHTDHLTRVDFITRLQTFQGACMCEPTIEPSSSKTIQLRLAAYQVSAPALARSTQFRLNWLLCLHRGFV
jgi:hypothetical protein